MICISVTPESRKLAKVDLLNASRQGDLIELCLDHLIKEPDVGDLLADVAKPVIVSCRRGQDGGHFQGTEDQRRGLLRQAIVAEPEYVELDLDIAGTIPRFGKTKRIISYAGLDERLDDVSDILEQACKADADIVKFTWPTPTLEAAWPLLSLLTKKNEVPLVGVGVGVAGTAFSLLARRYGSPWIYAALEKGMEAHADQATVEELTELYGWNRIGSQTRFVGVVGTGPSEQETIRIWNRAFRDLEIDKRCLPISSSDFGNLKKLLSSLRIRALLVGAEAGSSILDIADKQDEPVRQSESTDILLNQPEGWHAYNRLWRSTVKITERRLGEADGGEHSLKRRNLLIIGDGSMAQSLAYGVHKNQGILSITSPRDKRARKIAEKFDLRHVPFANLYDTLSDVILMADSDIAIGHHKTEINPSFLRPNMTIVDVCLLPWETEFLREARERGAAVVSPREIFTDRTCWQFRTINGQKMPQNALRDVIAGEG